MKKIILFFALMIGCKAFAFDHNYKLDDNAIDQKFEQAESVNLSTSTLMAINANVIEGSKSNVTAGLLGIFCGGLGIHRFYLGQGGAGAVYLVGTLCIGGVGALVATSVGAPVYCFNPFALIGFIDGIVYLVADDQTFQSKYAANKKLIQWL